MSVKSDVQPRDSFAELMGLMRAKKAYSQPMGEGMQQQLSARDTSSGECSISLL